MIPILVEKIMRTTLFFVKFYNYPILKKPLMMPAILKTNFKIAGMQNRCKYT